MGDLFFRIGRALGGFEARLRPARLDEDLDGGEGGSYEAGDVDRHGDGDGGDGLPPESVVARDAALTAAGAWLVARLLRPHPVRWGRVVLAGAAAALLADLVGRMEADGGDAAADGPAATGRLPFARDPAELIGRVTAGVAVAAGYASLLYPRLPGSPLLRGLAFGALEIAAAPRGGLIRLAAETPGIRFPLQALALPVDEDASPVSHLAFGLALGLLYRGAEVSDSEDIDDDDDLED